MGDTNRGFVLTKSYKTLLLCALGAGLATAQNATPAPAEPAGQQSQKSGEEPVDKRIFGVMPNYRTANLTADYQPLTARRKMYIAVRDSFDWPSYFVGGAFALLYQLEDSNPSFGQGLKGYAHRYATAQSDQIIGNMLVEGTLPALLHEDPRYFRLGSGASGWKRFRYAATRVVITRADSGGKRFNTSEILGNTLVGVIGNAYYPDNRTVYDTFQRAYTQIATDAFSNVLKEFWPDIKHKLLHK